MTQVKIGTTLISPRTEPSFIYLVSDDNYSIPVPVSSIAALSIMGLVGTTSDIHRTCSAEGFTLAVLDDLGWMVSKITIDVMNPMNGCVYISNIVNPFVDEKEFPAHLELCLVIHLISNAPVFINDADFQDSACPLNDLPQTVIHAIKDGKKILRIGPS